jgi:hypothetical protein
MLSELELQALREALQGALAEGEDCLTPALLEDIETALATLGVKRAEDDETEEE